MVLVIPWQVASVNAAEAEKADGFGAISHVDRYCSPADNSRSLGRA